MTIKADPDAEFSRWLEEERSVEAGTAASENGRVAVAKG